jgi:hypothetical protein
MEEHSLLENLGKVQAPPDFEQKVMERIFIRKEKRRHWLRNLQLSFAGSFALLLIGFVLLNVFVFHHRGPEGLASLDQGTTTVQEGGKGGAVRAEIIPIIEKVDYSREIRNLSYEPRTIYILEHVSPASNTAIRY